jgi:UDP-N-acetylmuramoyl-L-alanyl-D-glutamate--2,6-diaminopimelate ligase
LLTVPEPLRAIQITGLTNDSRTVQPGELFFAVRGYKTDGRLYIDEAMQRGAPAIVVDGTEDYAPDLPLLKAANVREIEGLVAARFYGNPSERLRMIGVTGTNGKTTVTHLIQHILNAAGIATGLIGTVWIDLGRNRKRSERTTPDAIELQRNLAEMADSGLKTVAMEVSSHALALFRVSGIEYDVGVLTNITHDHFDFHLDYHSYLKSKSLLFTNLCREGKSGKYAVLNAEDPSAAYIAKLCSVPVAEYGKSPDAPIRLKDVVRKGPRSNLTIDLYGEECRIVTALPGQFNTYNILAAVGVAFREGATIPQIEAAVPRFPGVPGRYQEVSVGQPFRVMVDFAHNPAALENILQMARDETSGRRIIVFGCEGEKDRIKRPMMGRIAVDNAEVPILTSDNLYHEDIGQIFDDVLRDLPEQSRRSLIVEPDRREAIKKAVAMAEPGDFIIVAGKGHEQYLVKGSEYEHFNDVEVVKEILANQMTLV